jgi:hypothetical protein
MGAFSGIGISPSGRLKNSELALMISGRSLKTALRCVLIARFAAAKSPLSI